MYKPFQELSDQAYVWIYQSDRVISPAEQQTVLEKLAHFLSLWSSHGRPLLAGAEIRHGYFLIIGIEKTEFELSCCTMDSLVQFLQLIKATLMIDFLDRNRVLLQAANQHLSLPLYQAKQKLRAGELDQDSYVFDNTITYKNELKTRWCVPVGQFFA